MVDSPRLASVSANGRDFAEYIAPGEGERRLGTSYIVTATGKIL